MSGATAFDYDSARRIARTVHGFERQNGDQSAKRPKTRGDDRGPMVKTPATLPGGYDGTDPLEGTMVERLPDDSILEIATVYIKNADDIALEADKVYLARASGHATISSTPRPLFLVDVSSGGLSANYIGETCLGYHRPGVNANPVYSGGSFGYGYTEVSVPVGPGSDPESVLETWRLQHQTHRPSNDGVWSAYNYQTGIYKVPASYLSSKHTFRFVGKRGDQYAASCYNCYHYGPQNIAVLGTIKVSEDFQNNSFTLDGINFYRFNQYSNGHYPVFGTMQTVKWNTQGWIGSSNLTGAFLNIMSWWNTAKRGPENIAAWIGYTWPNGWHPIMIDPVPQKIAGYGPSGYYIGPYPTY